MLYRSPSVGLAMCDICNSRNPSVQVQLRHNVGMLLMRRVYETEGRLCDECLGRAFRKHQLSNLFLGWWGMISFCMTCIFLVENTLTFFRARGELREWTARKETTRVEPQGTPGERLAPFRHNVRLRLKREDAARIAADLADTHEVPLPDAEAFVQSVEQEFAAPV
jgi:hypothetical protein